MIGIGAAIGVAIIALDQYLKKIGAAWHVPVLACAVGIYLPLELSVPIFAGGFVAHLVERRFPPEETEGDRERIHQKGTLFSAGLITGEALMGIIIAIPIVAVGTADVLALPPSLHFGGWLGLVFLAGIGVLLYRTAVDQPGQV
jgi:putative OPT family oligopeptide transporter